MWFGYKEESAWYPLNVDRVNEILVLNSAGRKPATLEQNEIEEREPVSVLNSDLEKLDKKFSNKGGRNKKKSRNRRRDGQGGGPSQGTGPRPGGPTGEGRRPNNPQAGNKPGNQGGGRRPGGPDGRRPGNQGRPGNPQSPK